MPSGHTVNVAAAATALAEVTGSDAVLVGGMALAAIAGASRLVKERHWASDVVGLLLGYTTAKAAGALDRTCRLLCFLGESASSPVAVGRMIHAYIAHFRCPGIELGFLDWGKPPHPSRSDSKLRADAGFTRHRTRSQT